MANRIVIEGNTLEVNGRFTYTRQVGDLGDVATSNANYTNSFGVIRDQNSIRAFKGLSLPGSISDLPYEKFQGQLVVDEIPVIGANGWAVISESNLSDFKISILDGNIDFWKAVEGLTLADIDLSEAKYSKTRNGMIDSFSSPYSKYIIGNYGGTVDPYEINLLNPSISEKYIWDQIFSFINMGFEMTPVIDSWLVVNKETDAVMANVLTHFLESVPFGYYDYIDGIGGYLLDYQQIDLVEGTFDVLDAKITIEVTGLYNFTYDFDKGVTRIALMDPSGNQSIMDDFPLEVYLEVNGVKYQNPQDVYLFAEDEIYLRLEPISMDRLDELGYEGWTFIKYLRATIENFTFELERYETVQFTFSDSLKNIKVTDFIKLMMHKYSFTLFYEDRMCKFMTIDERIAAPVQNLNQYFIDRTNEQYIYRDYAQRNILKHKYNDELADFNNGIIFSNNKNLDWEKVLLESFTYSQDEEGVMRMFDWEIKEDSTGVFRVYKPIKDRFFSIRQDTRDETIQLTLDRVPVASYVGPIPFADFTKTGFRYFKNEYWQGFEDRILKNSKKMKFKMDMPISIFLNLDLKKVFYIEQSNFLINKITYKGIRDVEVEAVKIN